MTVLRSLVMAFACFSRIPTPNVEWKPESMRFMMCFFPLVGAVIGALVWAWCALVDALGLGMLVRGAGIALIPLAVTGGIHLDGLADVFDAQSSHASPERKREILKDPHLGAFAAIGIGAYLICSFAFACEVPICWQACALIVCLHVFSRCLSGIATTAFPQNASNGMLAQFHDSANRASVAVLAVCALATAAIMVVLNAPVGLAMVGAGVLSLLWIYVFSRTQFGGMSGDLAGCFLQVAELAMLACLVVVGKVVGL